MFAPEHANTLTNNAATPSAPTNPLLLDIQHLT
jgi:hypothetical protein